MPLPPPLTNSLTSVERRPPDYAGLVKFLLAPLLDVPESLRVDCETYCERRRVWIRLAFEQEDKGRAFGRGGRNIQAVRTVLAAAATAARQTVYLEIHGAQEQMSREEGSDRRFSGRPPYRSGGGGTVGRRPRRPLGAR